jgi:hypothetical protein
VQPHGERQRGFGRRPAWGQPVILACLPLAAS